MGCYQTKGSIVLKICYPLLFSVCYLIFFSVLPSVPRNFTSIGLDHNPSAVMLRWQRPEKVLEPITGLCRAECIRPLSVCDPFRKTLLL